MGERCLLFNEPPVEEVEEVIYVVEGSCFSPLTEIAQEPALPLALCRCPINATSIARAKMSAILDPPERVRTPESPINLLDSSEDVRLAGEVEAVFDRSRGRNLSGTSREATPKVNDVDEATVDHMPPIRSAGGVGSAGSIRETLGVFKDAAAGHMSPVRSAGGAGSVGSVGETSSISRRATSSIALVSNGVGISDLNVDNIDQPLELPGADDLILFGSFFSLAFVEHAERSPLSIHRAGLSGVRDFDDDFSKGSAPKDVDAMLRNTTSLGDEVEPVAPWGGAATEAIVPNTDGSSCNSSVGQHVPTGDASGRQDTMRGEAERRLVERCDAEAAIISAAKARMAEINVELMSCRKVVEECHAIMDRNESHL
ncbi:hypothetical protein ACLOJK_004181 [Asimina triloba]